MNYTLATLIDDLRALHEKYPAINADGTPNQKAQQDAIEGTLSALALALVAFLPSLKFERAKAPFTQLLNVVRMYGTDTGNPLVQAAGSASASTP